MLRRDFSLLWVLVAVLLNSCYHPPYNNFKPYNPLPQKAAIGAGVGAIIGTVAGSTLIGTGVGAAAFTARGVYKSNKKNVLRDLNKGDIQYIAYGDTHTLVVPTDRYYIFDSAQLNELCYPNLINIIRLLNFYPYCTIYVAGFTDNIGSRIQKKTMSQARAEAMLTFLWANGINADRLHAEGYGDQHTVSENSIIHGSAHNRRIEIQWFCAAPPNRLITSAPMK